ncbi:S8 family serine peptidase [Chitinophaga sp. RAB17]|uniref:S8 family serine peptidase n=1 Tax=Chitinophaga sp. RAB17 TaxID=3233049 RepID=UPI003F8E5206
MKPLQLNPMHLCYAGMLFVLLQACNGGANEQKSDSTRKEQSYPEQNKATPPHKTDSPYKAPEYKPNELVIYFKKTPTPAEITALKTRINAYIGNNSDSIRTQRCNSCTAVVELWQATDIHTFVHADGVKGGASTGNGSKGVGEDSLAYYTQNYHVDIPTEQYIPADIKRKLPPAANNGGDNVIVALLDTGVDTTISFASYLWTNPAVDRNCYTGDLHGWNFVDHSANIQDNNPAAHGTIISQFIINEFQRRPGNNLQLMVLKTHDSNGNGNLFDIICALNYAASHDAKIINASWGFYSNYSFPSPYYPIDSLITQDLAARGILFITAAGNRIEAEDNKGKLSGIKETDLRDLKYHHFFPACLGGTNNNILVVTTVNDTTVSPTQNYSDSLVDLGVKADLAADGFLKFKVPLVLNEVYISGSSFATAIATGKIGAICKQTLYKKKLNKTQFITALGTAVLTAPRLSAKKQVREGRFIRPR